MTKEQNRINGYKKHKALLFCGINYGRVIAIKSYNITVKKIIKEFVRTMCYNYIFSVDKMEKSKLVFVYSFRHKKRADCDYIFDHAVMFARNNNVPCDVIEFKRTWIGFSFKKLIFLMAIYLKYIFSRVNSPFWAAIMTTQFLQAQKIIEKTLKTSMYKSIITFCDAHTIENLCTQVAQKQGLITGTLQHGQYTILSVGKINPDAELYNNFISDYLLSWGIATKSEFVKFGIEESRILCVGAIKPFSYYSRDFKYADKDVFGVILSGNKYYDINMQMIKIANDISVSTGMKYVIRLHPQNNPKELQQLCNLSNANWISGDISGNEFANLVDFSIIYMSGTIVELLSLKSPIFVYDDGLISDIYKLEGACFGNINEFWEIYEKFRLDKLDFIKRQYNLYRNFNCAINLEIQYKDAYLKHFLLE